MDVSVVGLGKLGLPLAAVLARRGHRVVGVDLNSDLVELVKEGISPYKEAGLQEYLDETVPAWLSATTDTSEAVRRSDATFILAPTPSLLDGSFSNEYVLQVASAIGPVLAEKEWHLVVVSSTVMPGSTMGVIREALETLSGKRVGVDFGLCYSPEFIALGSVIHDMENPDLVLIGASDERAAAELAEISRSVVRSHPEVHVLSVVEAEIAKIAVNSYVTMKISFANTLAEVCEGFQEADARNVTAAIGADSRIGRKYLTPATAFGGPCFNRDNTAFSRAAHGVGVTGDLAAATDKVNEWQVERLGWLVKKMRPSEKIGILGLSYKPDTPVVDMSVGTRLIETLGKAEIRSYDPMASGSTCRSAQECVDGSDLVVVCTPWPQFADLNYDGKVVIDCWGLVERAGKLYRIGAGLC